MSTFHSTLSWAVLHKTGVSATHTEAGKRQQRKRSLTMKNIRLSDWRHSGESLFLLEIGVKSTLCIVLQNNTVYREMTQHKHSIHDWHVLKWTNNNNVSSPCIQTQSWISWLEWWTTVPRGSVMLMHIYQSKQKKATKEWGDAAKTFSPPLNCCYTVTCLLQLSCPLQPVSGPQSRQCIFSALPNNSW